MTKRAAILDETNAWQEPSSCSPHAKLIHNRLALQVLETVYHAIPPGTHHGAALDNPVNVAPVLHDYQNWVHDRLRASGLAKALAAGEAFLPDIAEELPQPWRYLARLFAPRNYRQLTLQVLGNLAWYLGERSRPMTPAHKIQSVFWPTFFLTGLMLVTLLLATPLGTKPWSVIVLAALALAAFIFGTAYLWGQDTTGRASVNGAELYAYLLESYAEPGEEEENKVKSILMEFDRDTDNTLAGTSRRAGHHRGPWDTPS